MQLCYHYPQHFNHVFVCHFGLGFLVLFSTGLSLTYHLTLSILNVKISHLTLAVMCDILKVVFFSSTLHSLHYPAQYPYLLFP